MRLEAAGILIVALAVALNACDNGNTAPPQPTRSATAATIAVAPTAPPAAVNELIGFLRTANARYYAVGCIARDPDARITSETAREVQAEFGLTGSGWQYEVPEEGMFLVSNPSRPATNVQEFERRQIGDAFVCLLPEPPSSD